eukprot:jgi/Mesvir1/3892/Mv19838-RA.2
MSKAQQMTVARDAPPRDFESGTYMHETARMNSTPSKQGWSATDAHASLGRTLSRPPAGGLGQAVIPIVNKLQDIFAHLRTAPPVELPQVVVVGSQSSGKSSVLEALVGRDFLPRGAGICTRRPLVLQLVHTPAGQSDEGDEWGEFLHAPGKLWYNFDEIREEIKAETDRETGSNYGVSDKQIRLKICSPHVLTITLVDLPGIIKVPVGDQPDDIEGRIRAMVLGYIQHDTSVILAVSPANADLANSDALQLARMVDPAGVRTIGVITKLDIMDRGTDARRYLQGKVVPLRLGFVGVVNRCQQDVDGGRPIRDALRLEAEFFSSSPAYRDIPELCGIPNLAAKLNTILALHIYNLLPELRARTDHQLRTVTAELALLGDEPVKDGASQGRMLLSILTAFASAFSAFVEGRNEALTCELAGGARIHYIFQDIFVKSLEEVDPCDDLTDADIRTALQNATGPRAVLFVPEVPFEMLVRRQISRLQRPSLQCARFVYEELVKVSRRCEEAVEGLYRFGVLRHRMEEIMGTFLREALVPAESMIRNLVAMEMDFINTSHPNFIGGHRAVAAVLSTAKIGLADMRHDRGYGRDNGGAGEGGAERDNSTHSWGLGSAAATPREPPSNQGGAMGYLRAGVCALTKRDRDKEPPPSSREGAERDKGADGSSVHGYAGSSKHGAASLLDAPPDIRLQEPPAYLRAGDPRGDADRVEISVTRLLVRSYYDIVRKNLQDAVPKATMHFLVNHVKRELQNKLIEVLFK